MTEKEALAKLEFFKNAIISLKGRVSELEKKAEIYKDEARKAENNLNLYKSDAEGLNHKNRQLQDDINYLEKTIAEMKATPNKEIEKEFAEYKARTEEELKACGENIEALLHYKEWYNNIVVKQNAANSKIEELKSKLAEAEKGAEKRVDNDIAELKNKLTEAEKEIARYKSDCDELKARLIEKEKKIANLEMALTVRSSSENVMIVKSAERELKEMIDQS